MLQDVRAKGLRMCHNHVPQWYSTLGMPRGRFCTADRQRPIVIWLARAHPENHRGSYVHKAKTAALDSTLSGKYTFLKLII